ncbi:MAG TPA: hypothetical protein PL071_12275 [Nitrosomonas sp.]|nr:hypothetical protein [Nitrosomonas sp.]
MKQWTAEERLRQSQLIKNWRPWEQSTGATTSQGKARSSQNAYKHGIGKLKKEIRAVLKQQEQFLERFEMGRFES